MRKFKSSITMCILLMMVVMVIVEVHPTYLRRKSAELPSYPEYASYNSLTDDLQEALFQTSMDPYTRPCDDFYRYACGNWHSNSERDYQETLTKLDFDIKQEMQNILYASNQGRRRQPKFVREVFNYYKSCIATEAPETVDYMKWLENNERGLTWPLNTGNDDYRYSYRYDWIEMLAMLRKYGMNDVIFRELASPTDSNPNILTLELGRPQSGKTSENTLRYDVVTGTLRFFMAQEQYHNLWNDIQDLDGKLMQLHSQFIEEDAVMFSTLGDMSMFPWLHKFLGILLENENLDPNMELVITNLPYLRAVVEFLESYDAKFVCEYLQIKFLSYLNHKQFQPEYRDCVSSTRLLLPLPSQYLYEQQHPELEYEISRISLMFTNLKRSFQKILGWNVYKFEQSALKYLTAKLRNLQLRMGYLSSKSLEELYKNLSLNSQDYYGNRLKIYNYHFTVTHRSLNVRLKRDALEFLPLEEYDTAAGLQPYILSRQRAVVVPLSILQHPFYRPELPIAYQYSSIGFLIARKIIWEFSIADIDVNAYGQIFAPMLDKFLSEPSFKADYEHMGNYHTGASEQVDSAIIGLKLAYHAFKEEQAGGSDMSKSFFLNFAQMFCGSLDSNYHRPSKNSQNDKIVNNAVTHVGDFFHAFGCQRGPVHGVLYWGSSHADVY